MPSSGSASTGRRRSPPGADCGKALYPDLRFLSRNYASSGSLPWHLVLLTAPVFFAFITLIRYDCFCRRNFGNQGGCLGAVIDMSTSDFKLDGQTMGVHSEVSFAGIAGSTFSYRFISATGSAGTVLMSTAVHIFWG